MVIGMAILCFAVGGLAVDGTRAFLLRRSLQTAADAASLAGAGQLDRNLYYSSGGRRIVLDRSAAQRVAVSYVGRKGLDARAAVTASGHEVHVILRASMPTSWLGLVGIRWIPVAAESRSRPESGVP
jgi:uncharacterized membrane protein